MQIAERSEEVQGITFQNERVAPPSDLYMTRMDALFITSYNSAVGITIQVRYTFLRVDGVVIVGVLDTHTPNTDRSGVTTVQPLGEGYLLSACVFLGSGTSRRGQTYVQVGVARGVAAARLVHRIIMQGYVGTAINLAWPGNRLEQPREGSGYTRAVTGTNPAPGVEINEVVPTGATWRLTTVRVALTSSATVATRRPLLQLNRAGATVLSVPHPQTQLASLTRIYNWALGMALAVTVTTDSNITGLPIDMYLAAGDGFSTATEAIQAGDDYAAPSYSVEEYIEP